MEAVLDYLRDNPGPWTLVILFCAAALEYMVPPLPADTIILAGSLVVVAGAWRFTTVLAVVVAGGFAGSISHYVLGRYLVDDHGNIRGQRFVERLTGRGSMDRFVEAFRKYGAWVLVVNRMLPGVRAAVFLAAGASRLPPVRTLVLGLVSNVLWSLLILGAGVLIGGNLALLETMLGRYQTAAAVVLALIVIGFVIHRRRARRSGTTA